MHPPAAHHAAEATRVPRTSDDAPLNEPVFLRAPLGDEPRLPTEARAQLAALDANHFLLWSLR